MTDSEITPIQPPSKATLAKYGFGCGPAAHDEDSARDWLCMLMLQGNVCPICGKTPTPSKTSGLVRMVIDHLHVRGWKVMPPERRRQYVRGLTCWFCNATYLGRSITVAKAEAVVRYLKAFEERRPK